MIRWIIGTSLRSRLPLIAVAVAVIAVGIVRLGTLPVEALPEFMPTRVEVQTEAIGLSAEEVENLITNPMEQEFFNGMPWLDKIRSDSIPGLSSVANCSPPQTRNWLAGRSGSGLAASCLAVERSPIVR